jgi:hypothetical protein
MYLTIYITTIIGFISFISIITYRLFKELNKFNN